VGLNGRLFNVVKFRSMRTDAEQDGQPRWATAKDDRVTRVGRFLRRYSLDELPQLWSILAGDMSFVGPRPALFNQQDLIDLRTAQGVHTLVPGLTGWAQVNGRDELPIPDKVKLDVAYLQRQSLWFDIRILWLTFIKVLRRDGVSH
jgi:O-antigen biosynthesis protein WbqP